jgi:DNA-binding transcriptional MocR family regulator
MIEFSSSARSMQSSEIRRLMKLAADPSVISFAGGMPNNSLFPVEIVTELYNSLPETMKQAAFQYSPTEGYPPLLEALKSYLKKKSLSVEDNALMITTGGQQAINLVTKVLVDPGETVLAEYPSFIGAIAAFRSYGANLISVDVDDDGIVLDELNDALARKEIGTKMLYVTPCFHNPAGILYSPNRKQALLGLLKEKTDICLLEDDPYNELYFDEADKALTKPIKAMEDPSYPICYVGSFSKIFGPGMRLGWVLGPLEIVQKCALAKQAMDGCSSTFTQVFAYAFLTQGKLEPYVEKLRKALKRRSEIMLKALDAYMPEGVTWTQPKGGFYVWVELPENVDSSAVFEESIKNGAAFVVGKAFDPEDKRKNCFRLAFSHTAEERIAEGTEIISHAVKSALSMR